jgi:hypothetical protein
MMFDQTTHVILGALDRETAKIGKDKAKGIKGKSGPVPWIGSKHELALRTEMAARKQKLADRGVVVSAGAATLLQLDYAVGAARAREDDVDDAEDKDEVLLLRFCVMC